MSRLVLLYINIIVQNMVLLFRKNILILLCLLWVIVSAVFLVFFYFMDKVPKKFMIRAIP